MDAPAKARPQAKQISYALLITALSPLLPQILGSAFNIWYNVIIVDPLLTTAALKQRFLTRLLFTTASVIRLWCMSGYAWSIPFDRR